MPQKAVFPGTFDPLTCGHLDLINRAAALFDEVILAVAASPGKRPLFSLDERIQLAQQACQSLSNVSITGFSNLLIDFMKEQNATILLRGIRTGSDFEYESQLAAMYRRMMPEMEIIFLPPAEQYAFVSSTLVREIALHGGDASQFVTDNVAEAIRHKQLLNRA
ncbi:pantetheine-phosphate adenylyltransferase [Tolumonas lignilytica]|jgi:pantetheine-phosphate adenylyltransferase, bacterial|uniref:pantetheine-phosphate adenylyltransferase n=1 Tax=Tolumonas lignilytica TaxID=1283284 RepID=UPI000464C5EC|nr:pantetheine-phosphate adenylyltransferase [Tolumonas lignilytica]